MAIYYDIQKDDDTGLWFFIVFTKNGWDVYESDPTFDSDTDAEAMALRWIADNLLPDTEE